MILHSDMQQDRACYVCDDVFGCSCCDSAALPVAVATDSHDTWLQSHFDRAVRQRLAGTSLPTQVWSCVMLSASCRRNGRPEVTGNCHVSRRTCRTVDGRMDCSRSCGNYGLGRVNGGAQ